MLTFPDVETSRLLLRALTPADVPTVVKYRADPLVERYQHWLPEHLEPQALVETFANQNFDRTVRVLMRSDGQPPWTIGGGLHIAIVLRESSTLIGDCTLVPMFDRFTCSLGYSLDPTYHRQGYATEAVTAVCRWALCQPRFSRVVAAVDIDNSRSIALLARIGMRQIGQQRTKNVRGEPVTVWWCELLKQQQS